jgi:two-component sensor histidine kinase
VKLVNNILIIYGIQKDEIDVKIDIVNTKVGVNKTQIIGQIINEILNNTFKHAFGTRTEKREIFVSLSQTDSIFELRVVDNGQGFDSNKLKTDRMGLSLIAAFVKSLRGEMITETGDNGTKYRIKFTQVS